MGKSYLKIKGIKMTIDDFCGKINEKINGFREWYREAQKVDSTDFPEHFPYPEDWQHVFMFYIEEVDTFD